MVGIIAGYGRDDEAADLTWVPVTPPPVGEGRHHFRRRGEGAGDEDGDEDEEEMEMEGAGESDEDEEEAVGSSQTQGSRTKREALQAKLEEAVRNEDYESAILLREELDRLDREE